MQQINQAAAIPGAAVVYHASNNWLLYRFVGDLRSPARGADYVRTVGAVYDNAVMCATVGAIFGSVLPGLLPAAIQCGKLAAGVGGLDYLWQLAVSGGATSDGFIPVGSQEWPNGGEVNQFRVFNATAHGAEMSDSRTVVQIQRAFDRNFVGRNP